LLSDVPAAAMDERSFSAPRHGVPTIAGKLAPYLVGNRVL